MHIIIVDDDRELSNLLKKVLWVSFYAKAKALAQERQQITDSLDVQQFDTPQQALMFIHESTKPIDIVFTAIRIAEQEWLDFIATCRNSYRSKYDALIIVTERGRQHEIDQGLAAGAQDFLLKPFSPEDMIKHIFRVWNKQVS